MPSVYYDFGAAGDREDREHEDQVQREVDAFRDGKRAGLLEQRIEANKYPTFSREHEAWNTGWREGLSELMTGRRDKALSIAADLRARARRPCVPCTCLGKGLCRDVA